MTGNGHILRVVYTQLESYDNRSGRYSNYGLSGFNTSNNAIRKRALGPRTVFVIWSCLAAYILVRPAFLHYQREQDDKDGIESGEFIISSISPSQHALYGVGTL